MSEPLLMVSTREHPSDVPWDDPALIKAMLAMLH